MSARILLQQSRRRQPARPHASNVASSANLEKAVAAVAAVLGSETAEMLVIQKPATRGTRASVYAEHDRRARELVADTQTRLND